MAVFVLLLSKNVCICFNALHQSDSWLHLLSINILSLLDDFPLSERLFVIHFHFISSELREISMPKTVTCRVLSSDTLKTLSNFLEENDDAANQHLSQKCSGSQLSRLAENILPSLSYSDSSLVIAGLHACGDLSVTMLRWVSYCIIVPLSKSHVVFHYLIG